MKHPSMRIISATVLALIIISHVAYTRTLQNDTTNRKSPANSKQWQPSKSIPGGFRRDLVGDTGQPGPFKYQLKIPAGSQVAPHQHSKDVHVKVLSGSMFIIIGEPLQSSRAQHFKAGNVFVVPAKALHDEWWDEETIVEANGVGPMETVYKTQAADRLISRIDHIVYATPELTRGVEEIEKLVGIRATPGGHHPGRGTRNALLALGPSTYLEIIAPDPEQPPPKEPRPFGLDGLKESKLVAWFISVPDVERVRAEAVRNGVPLGAVKSGSRSRPDGFQLLWQYTDPWVRLGDGIVPLFIDWKASPHPALTAAKGATLVSLRAEHPDVRNVRGMLRRLKVDLPVSQGQTPVLIAVIEGPSGHVELR